MPQRQVYIDGLGPITISKKRGNSNLRLSVRPSGQIYLSMPYWAPYISGERFIVSRREWLKEQLMQHGLKTIPDNSLIGKNHRLHYIEGIGDTVKSSVTKTEIFIKTNLNANDSVVQEAVRKACEKALRMQAEVLLPQRLGPLSSKHSLPYKEVRLRKLTSRWGSCSSEGVITLSIYLVQLPWELIDYVLLHELVHVRHMNHGRQFWQLFDSVLPGSKGYQKQIRQFKPAVAPAN